MDHARGTVTDRSRLAAEERDGIAAPGGRPEPPARVVAAKVSTRAKFGQIWSSRELLWFLVRKELKVRYKNSVLGFVWSFLNPALVLMIYYVVFKYFLHNQTPDFALFLFSGLLAWNLFNNSLLSSAGVLVAHAGIVKKVAFPREVLALSQVGVSICYFFFQTCILVVFLAGFQVIPAFKYLPLLLLALLADIVLSAALAVFLSAVNVYLRDVQHFVEVLLVALFFSPPIVYPFAGIHLHHLKDLYLANPLVWIVLAFQRCLYGNVLPPGETLGGIKSPLPTWGHAVYLEGLGVVLAGSVILFFLAMLIFGRVEGNFAEEL
ncbi:MAG: ABC transporter permease [Actinomycetota bacterium]|nr:ABC transporter permease [Actinomycetota bacterium]